MSGAPSQAGRYWCGSGHDTVHPAAKTHGAGVPILDDSSNPSSSSDPVRLDRSTRRRTRRRVRHNLIIMASGLGAGWVVGVQFADTDLRTQFSAGTAYVGLGCVALSLVVGPLNVLRNRPNPVSSDLRRDLGIWGALVSLVHVGVGLTVHFRGRMHLYFLAPPEAQAWLPIRADAFGGANHLGVVAGIVLLVLLALSSDNALRRFGSKRWKRWQQLNYVGAVAILGHGVLYQLLEKRRVGLVVLFALVVAATLVLQLLGIRQSRRSRINTAERVWRKPAGGVPAP